MDEKNARRQIQELNAALKALDEDRDVFISLIRGYEGWLRLHGSDASPARATVPKQPAKRRPSRALKGTISLRKAVLQVIREAHGSPVHLKEIRARALGMGASTDAKDPDRIMDLVAYNLKSRSGQPLERVSPRSWRWTGE